ncbi:hypothetical protein G3M48_005598 [Beauveria asiatica]|uniref:Alpha N-terminal protein methyltransferase 1 n=1 Tax=Beauveria asiatica TaxID=1069075 RepID=A0AAW0RRA4_9HYPO
MSQPDQPDQPNQPTRIDELINTQAGRKYWENADASTNGMLGGIPAFQAFSHISRTDIQGSRAFLARLGIGLKGDRAAVKSVVDAGAGIGRITKDLLSHIAEEVDVIEPISRFTDPLQGTKGVRHIFNVGLEEWQPLQGIEYDLIWTQWCLGHLTDAQIVHYLETCKTVLRPETGLIIVKENLSTALDDMFDPVDSSVTRLDAKFLDLFAQANLKLIRTELQRASPLYSKRKLLPVRMYALKPQ